MIKTTGIFQYYQPINFCLKITQEPCQICYSVYAEGEIVDEYDLYCKELMNIGPYRMVNKCIHFWPHSTTEYSVTCCRVHTRKVMY